jgi:hypothetical protein
MGDTDLPGDRLPGSLPVPRDPADAEPGGPGTPGEWAVARGQVAGVLLALREAELEDGAVLPAPLAGGVALRAWATASRSGLSTADGRRALDVVGHAARVLGTRLCRLRVTGSRDALTTALQCEAVVHECEPEWLVAQVARVHGALSAPDPVSAHAVWRAF